MAWISVICNDQEAARLARMAYSILEGAPGSGDEAPSNRREQRIT